MLVTYNKEKLINAIEMLRSNHTLSTNDILSLVEIDQMEVESNSKKNEKTGKSYKDSELEMIRGVLNKFDREPALVNEHYLNGLVENLGRSRNAILSQMYKMKGSDENE